MSNDGSGLPPAGWYADPENPAGPRRWWTGQEWTAQREPVLPPPAPNFSAPANTYGLPADPTIGGSGSSGFVSLSNFFSFIFHAVANNWIPLVLIAIVSAIPRTVLYRLFLQLIDGVTANTETGELAGFDSSRLPAFAGVAAVSSVVGILTTLILVALILRYWDRYRGQKGEMAGVGTLGGSTRQAFRRLFPVIGWVLLGYIAIVVVFVLIVVVVVLLAQIHPALAVLGGVALFPVMVYLLVRYLFVLIAAVDQPGNPYRRSSEVTRGRWWRTVGYMLLVWVPVAIIASILGQIPALYSRVEVVENTVAQTVSVTASMGTGGMVVFGIVSVVTGLLQQGLVTAALVALYRSIVPRQAEGAPGQ